MVKMTHRQPTSDKNKSQPQITEEFSVKNSFQNNMSLQLFNLDIQVVFNEYMGCATFAPIDENTSELSTQARLLVTRYFFSQFWCEFTASILQEFFEEDVIYRNQQMDQTAKLQKLQGLSEQER